MISYRRSQCQVRENTTMLSCGIIALARDHERRAVAAIARRAIRTVALPSGFSLRLTRRQVSVSTLRVCRATRTRKRPEAAHEQSRKQAGRPAHCWLMAGIIAKSALSTTAHCFCCTLFRVRSCAAQAVFVSCGRRIPQGAAVATRLARLCLKPCRGDTAAVAVRQRAVRRLS